ncbi:alpha/beta fold hydrolase [Gandjariella thermophila]|uniref:Peptidase n=1 Tax=Gandjariella thermophila TaxID=1931992 RepID=A0A4D4J8H4_9PSEU|nr:alpha/beta hydrolase [Gandjariella thermophila]GDY32961.1 peptidase [Gandjariella thermophila]
MPRRQVARESRPARRGPVRSAALPALFAAALLGTLAGCAAGPSNRPVIAVRQDGGSSGSPPISTIGPKPVPPLERPGSPGITWSDCDQPTRDQLAGLGNAAGVPYQCGRVVNVLDAPGQPGSGTARISVLKAGDGPVPLVVVNDVGGEPGTLYAARLASQLPRAMLSTFSLIGVDRRGTGASDAAECVPPDVRGRVVGYDPSSARLDDLLDAARRASQECVLDLDQRLAALDTWRAAADLERLRQELDVPRLNAVGHGEGSRVLTTYMSRYPDRIGRIVLDGSPDPALDGTGQAEARAAGAEQTFGAFVTDCVAHGCPLGGDPRQAVRGLLDGLRQRPVTAPDGTQVTAGTALTAMLLGLADRPHWSDLAGALARARIGDVGGLAALVAPLLGGPDRNPARLDPQLVTGCNDTGTRLSPDRVARTAADWRGKYPLFGGLFADRLLWCSPWPVPQQTPPTTLAVPGAPPVLVLSTASDPITPAPGTERTAQQLTTGISVAWQGGGHGALATSPCATTAAQHFLVDGRAPTDGTVCPP